tara:strand:+ start:63 stop:560 length:498 start_codon:yes stop_codon:yes gene_type:complete
MKLDRALNFTPKLWNQVGQFVRGAIKQDALRGIMQDDKRPRYKQTKYKAYKRNDMRKFGRGEDKVGKGERLKGFEGRPINTNTSKVNLHLTGDMFKQVQVKPTSNSATITFLQGEKVLGNKSHGYNVFGLRNKNRKNALRFLDRQVKKNLKKLTSKPINIKIDKR